MRLKLKLKVDRQFNRLPLNYYYPVSSFIYKQLNRGDHDFASWLHQTGYTIKGKHFKHFTFSKIGLRNFKRDGDALVIFDEMVDLHLSFLPKKGIESFLIGLFQNLKMEITSGRHRAVFYVEQVLSLPEPSFTEIMRFKAAAPICIARPAANGQKEFLHPSHPEYSRRFFENLMFKYMSFKGIEAQFSSNLFNTDGFHFKYFEPCKSRLAAIKAGTPDETFIRGYFYAFEVNAPPELMRIGYYSGFGEKNSLGFGYVEVMKSEVKNE